MADFRALEFDGLRAAIRISLTLAPAVLVAVILGWAALTLWVFTTDVVSAATLVPLTTLVAGFEAVFALRAGAAHLARYLQVAYEDPTLASPTDTLARWESTAYIYRQRFASSGSNVAFGAVFVIAALVNYLPAAISGSVEELAGIGLAHVLFILRVVIAGRRAARARREDVERFRSLGATKNTPAE